MLQFLSGSYSCSQKITATNWISYPSLLVLMQNLYRNGCLIIGQKVWQARKNIPCHVLYNIPDRKPADFS